MSDVACANTRQSLGALQALDSFKQFFPVIAAHLESSLSYQLAVQPSALPRG
jgi:hypothetical protein